MNFENSHYFARSFKIFILFRLLNILLKIQCSIFKSPFYRNTKKKLKMHFRKSRYFLLIMLENEKVFP